MVDDGNSCCLHSDGVENMGRSGPTRAWASQQRLLQVVIYVQFHITAIAQVNIKKGPIDHAYL